MDKIIKKFSCKKPVYENCRMLAPDGAMLCFCDKRKMNWYIEKGIADQIGIDPPIFKLKFEPNARGCIDEENKQSDFYITDRKNCCVVCGYEKDYMRFYIVPIIYRTFLPHFLKSHKSHDVLLLCFGCHEKANKEYDIRKRELAIQYDIPLNSLTEEQKVNCVISKIKRNAEIMIKNFDKLPLDRKNELGGEIIECFNKNKSNFIYETFFMDIFDKDKSDILSIESKNDDYCNEENQFSEDDIDEKHNYEVTKNICFPNTVENLTKDLLIKIVRFDIKKLNAKDKKSLHGRLVIDKVDNYEEFIKSWREYFIKIMEPKFLPDSWNVNHQFHRTFGEYSKFTKELRENKENTQNKTKN